MNNKYRSKPHTLLAYEALFRRLKKEHRQNKIITIDYQKYNAGFYGERSVDYKFSLFPRRDFHYLTDIRLKNNANFFQMDSIIITPKLIFIIEIKNLKGILKYNQNQRQLIQIDGDRTACFIDPILQAETQR